jgi:hypothetical protein
MTVGRALFISGAAFASVIAIAYWISSRHPGGSILLGFMAAAMIFAAGFMFFAQREANLPADLKTVNFAEVAGEEIGTFTLSTLAPFLAALTVFGLLVGIVWSPFLAAVSLILLLLALGRLVRESNRTGASSAAETRQKSLQK